MKLFSSLDNLFQFKNTSIETPNQSSTNQIKGFLSFEINQKDNDSNGEYFICFTTQDEKEIISEIQYFNNSYNFFIEIFQDI